MVQTRVQLTYERRYSGALRAGRLVIKQTELEHEKSTTGKRKKKKKKKRVSNCGRRRRPGLDGRRRAGAGAAAARLRGDLRK